MSNHAINCVWELSGTSPTQTLILIALANKANNKHICWPSVATLSIETKLSESAINKNIKVLESIGLISKLTDYDRASTTYFLDFASDSTEINEKLSTGKGILGGVRGTPPPVPGTDKPTENHQFESSEKQEEKSLPVDNFLLAKKPSPKIGDILSAEQKHEISISLKKLNESSEGFYEVPTLDEVCYVLLDNKSFKIAGNDFNWKLNSIKKCISNGNFKVPAELEAKKHEEAQAVKNEEQRKVNEARQALRDASSSRDNYQLLINKTSHLGDQHVSELVDARDKVASIIPGLRERLRESLGRGKGVAYG